MRSHNFTALLITEDCARCIVLLKLTTDRHKALHGLSATAKLLVCDVASQTSHVE